MGHSSVFLTILRNPVDQFISQYNFYEFQNYTGLNMTEFVKR